MLGKLKKYSKIFFVLSFAYLSVITTYGGVFSAQPAKAADCTLPGPATKLAIYSTDKGSPYDRPDVSLDPQTVHVGQVSIRMEADVEDVNGCSVPAPDTTRVNLSTSDHAVDFLSSGGVNKGESYDFTIASGSKRGGFYVTGKSPANATLTVITREDSVVQLISGTQAVSVDVLAPVVGSLVFTNNPHGTSDTVSGLAGSVPANISAPGVIVRVFAPDGVTQLGFVTANADGSFDPIPSGDDQYRQVILKAEYPGGVLSDSVLFNQNYPSLITDLKISHDLSSDQPTLSWTATESGATFMVYRTLYAADPAFIEANAVTPIPIVTTSFTDSTAVPGVRYSYAVKQVVAAAPYNGSYTPEFRPLIDIRLDLSGAAVTPIGGINIATVVKYPTVTVNLTADLINSFLADTTTVKVQWVNTTTSTTYLSNMADASLAGVSLTASKRFVDNLGNQTNVLPDGVYQIKVIALDPVKFINDTVTVSENYLIDNIAPVAPVLSKLRYKNNVLSGLAGAVEGSDVVNVYSDSSLAAATLIATLTANADGTFSSESLIPSITVPAGGVFYLTATDAAGNVSTTYTSFDVIHIPATPVISKLVMHQNAPGTADVLEGLPGAVAPGSIVRIYGADLAQYTNLVPLYEFVANADGSFSQAVGDNLYNDLWVASWSGADLLSPAVHITNTTSIAAPSNFSAKSGDGTVTLSWNLVSGATFYSIVVYDITTSQNIAQLTVAGNQNLLVLTLANNHNYRFYITAMDAYGNISAASETAASPQATVVSVSSTTSTPSTEEEPAPIKHYALDQSAQPPAPQVSEAPSPSPSPAPSNSGETKNWTPWIIAAGLIILAIAALAGYFLWIREPGNTVVATVKKPTKSSSPKSDDKNGDDKTPKPRW